MNPHLLRVVDSVNAKTCLLRVYRSARVILVWFNRSTMQKDAYVLNAAAGVANVVLTLRLSRTFSFESVPVRLDGSQIQSSY